MITVDQLKDIAKIKGLTNLGHAEKDYIQELILLIIYRNFDYLVFKGGTALYKLYKLNRFSEDLDFGAIKELNENIFLTYIKNGLKRFDIELENIRKKKAYDSILIKLLIKGLLYTGERISTCSLRIDINKKSNVIEYNALNISSLYPDIPTFQILAMSEKEILAEKIRALLTRNYARDLYDIYFLIDKNIECDKDIIEKKLFYYNKKINKTEIKRKIKEKKDIWNRELLPLVKDLPNFNDVSKKVEKILLNKLSP